MSIIRIVRPYSPVDPTLFHDLGPARARLSHEGYFGGPIEPSPRRAERARLEREQRPPVEIARCGFMMPIAAEPCARRPHSDGEHRTAEAVRRDNDRRRVRHAR